MPYCEIQACVFFLMWLLHETNENSVSIESQRICLKKDNISVFNMTNVLPLYSAPLGLPNSLIQQTPPCNILPFSTIFKRSLLL